MPDHPPRGGVAPDRIAALMARETARCAGARPRTRQALDYGAAAFLDGVPMHWMKDWPTPFPLLIAKAKGARLTDLDGHEIDDFCLGDTASLFGHSPKPVARALRRQARQGLTYMLPTVDALAVGMLLTARFGDYLWQIATTATDANRFALKVARAVTGRPRVLVFDGAYHGTVDETMVALQDGRTVARPGLVGMAGDPAGLAVAVPFNDIAAVEAALAAGEIAAVIAEPVMTNSCMVLPAPGFHAALREATRRHGALLIIDETHCIASAPGGYTALHGLEPDILTCGKAVAGGVPAAVWGLTSETAARFSALERAPGHSGMGTTLSASPLQFAALRATLEEVMTPRAYARMSKGAHRLARGLGAAITRHGAPWHVARVGARVEFICAPGPLRDGAEAARAHAPELEAAVHLALLNRGALIAPFHNMMLVSPVTTRGQIDRLVDAFDAVLAELFA